MDIGNIIRDRVYEGQALWTPGSGKSRAGRVRFYVSELRNDWLKFDKITWRVRFRHLEQAMSGLHEAGSDMKIASTHGWAERGTFCRLLQDARGNSGMDSSYVVPLLVECGLLEYVWIDRVWGIRATDPVP